MTNCIVQNCPNRDTIKCECVRYMTSGETFYSNNTNTPSSGYSSVDANDLAIKSLKAQGYIVISPEEAKKHAEECHKRGIEYLKDIIGKWCFHE